MYAVENCLILKKKVFCYLRVQVCIFLKRSTNHLLNLNQESLCTLQAEMHSANNLLILEQHQIHGLCQMQTMFIKSMLGLTELLIWLQQEWHSVAILLGFANLFRRSDLLKAFPLNSKIQELRSTFCKTFVIVRGRLWQRKTDGCNRSEPIGGLHIPLALSCPLLPLHWYHCLPPSWTCRCPLSVPICSTPKPPSVCGAWMRVHTYVHALVSRTDMAGNACMLPLWLTEPVSNTKWFVSAQIHQLLSFTDSLYSDANRLKKMLLCGKKKKTSSKQ